MNSRTGCTKLALALMAAAVVATPAFAQNQACVQDAYNNFNGSNKNLSCTANDVSIAAVVPGSVVVFQGGLGDNSNKCISGGTFSFTANFGIDTSSSSARSNVGIFFAGGSQTQAKTGQCSDAILSKTHPCAFVNGTATATCGSNEYEELDQAINGETAATFGCGDSSSNDGGTASPGIQHSVLEVDGVTCPSTASPCPTGIGLDGQSCLALNYCTSWYQPAKGMPVCSSPTWSWVNTAIPGTSSKCDCSIVYVPVQPITPAITVTKRCNIGGSDSTSCDLGAEGGTVTYKVNITNSTPSGEGGVILDQICDNRYGTVYRNSAAPGTLTTCTGGTVGSINSGSFACDSGATVVNGEYDIKTSATCSFTVAHGENLSVTDTATVYTQSDLSANTPATPQPTNTVTVTSSDAPTTATTSASVEGAPQAACVTARFDVTVRNTGAADESVTLATVGAFGGAGYTPALNDTKTFGDITHAHGVANTTGTVVASTCAPVPAGGGTFSTTLASGTGTPPTTNGGTYSCTFDGVVCGTPTAIPNVCSNGLTTQVSVTPNLTGDDAAPNADVVTVTPSTLNANICLSISGS